MPTVLSAGKLNRRLTILRKSVTLSGVGEEVETWSTLSKVWAQKVSQRGTETFRAQQQVAETVVFWKIRYMEGLTVQDRINDGERVYDIKAIGNLDLRRSLEIMAEARAE